MEEGRCENLVFIAPILTEKSDKNFAVIRVPVFRCKNVFPVPFFSFSCNQAVVINYLRLVKRESNGIADVFKRSNSDEIKFFLHFVIIKKGAFFVPPVFLFSAPLLN